MLEESADQATQAVADARERGEQAMEAASESFADFRSTIESSVRAQPITALAIAAVAGLAFGALLRSGRTE
jgi:ElaB/YqjD/DUF883 family membrane-anchored ribosome-binding protein